MKKLENKTVFITGGLSGIGKACAIRAAEEGANVVVADLKSVELDTAMRDIQAENAKSIFVECDVCDNSQVSDAIAKTIETFGQLDVALNDAGVAGEAKRVHEMTVEEWNKVIQVNLTGIFNCMKHELVNMTSRKQGVIVNMSSVLGKVGYAGSTAYTAAKHGILGLTKSAALEYAHEGIRINALCPGFVKTPLLTKGGIDNEKLTQQITDLHPLKRLGKVEDIAEAFIFLASDQSCFVTGSALDVDGGYLAQ